MVGTTISHYEILEKIGQGGMGEVFLAQDASLDRKVALKFLSEELQQDPTARKRFLREAKSAAALDHPYVCKIYEIGEAEETSYIAMEYVEGTTLKDKLAKGPLGLKNALVTAVEIAEALEAADKRNIVHRDLKPSNVMLTSEGHVKVMDFGLAKQLPTAETIESREETISTGLTTSGTILGTLAYMSPEQVRGQRVDTRSDIFSFGVLLYEMLTGVHPFQKDSVADTTTAILSETPPRLTRYTEETPELLQHTVRKMLAKAVDRRFQSIHEVRTDLGELLTDSGRTVLIDSFVKQPRFSVRQGAGILAGGLLLSSGILWFLGLLPSPNDVLVKLNLIEATPSQLPEQKHVAVMPFSTTARNPSDRAFGEGLAEAIIRKFSRLEREFSGSFWVVPAADLSVDQMASAAESKQAFGVTLVVDANIDHENNHYWVTLNLRDASNWQTLASEVSETPLANVTVFQDELVLKLAEMMGMKLEAPARRRLRAGNTLSVRALDSFLRGRGYLKRYNEAGNIDHAIKLLEDALQADSNYANACAVLGEAYWRKYQSTQDVQWIEKAKDYANKAIELDKQVSTFHLVLGRIQAGTDNPETAIDAFQTARKLGAFAAYQELASTYEGMGRLEDAENFYEMATGHRSNYWASHRDLGVFYYRQGRYDEAATHIETAVSLRPGHISGYNDLGAVYFYLERWQEARQQFERSLAIEENYNAFSNLGTLDFQEGHFADAVESFRKALELDDSDYLVWGNLASAYEHAGQEQMAQPNFQKAINKAERELQANPGDPYILCDLAGYFVGLREHSKARSLLVKVQALHSGDPDIMLRIGENYFHLQDSERALQWIEKAIEHGYPKEHLRGNPSLRPLLSNKRFQSLLQDRGKIQ